MPLALSCELPGPGTYKALDVADVPVLITRARDGYLHAMINACRHRGSPVASVGTGHANRLTCPYHAWSYDLKGCLSGIDGEKTFADIDRSQLSLRSLPVEERAGIIFVGIADGVLLWACPWTYVRDVVVPEVSKGRTRRGLSLDRFAIVPAIPSAGFDDDIVAYDGAAPDVAAPKAAISEAFIAQLCGPGNSENVQHAIAPYRMGDEPTHHQGARNRLLPDT